MMRAQLATASAAAVLRHWQPVMRRWLVAGGIACAVLLIVFTVGWDSTPTGTAGVQPRPSSTGVTSYPVCSHALTVAFPAVRPSQIGAAVAHLSSAGVACLELDVTGLRDRQLVFGHPRILPSSVLNGSQDRAMSLFSDNGDVTSGTDGLARVSASAPSSVKLVLIDPQLAAANDADTLLSLAAVVVASGLGTRAALIVRDRGLARSVRQAHPALRLVLPLRDRDAGTRCGGMLSPGGDAVVPASEWAATMAAYDVLLPSATCWAVPAVQAATTMWRSLKLQAFAAATPAGWAEGADGGGYDGREGAVAVFTVDTCEGARAAVAAGATWVVSNKALYLRACVPSGI
jgi:hypothetical protein